MSMNPHFYVMVGAVIPRDEFPGDLWEDEKWLPYVEGHEGVEMAILHGEGDSNFYCGKVYAQADTYEGGGHKSFDLPNVAEVANWLRDELGYQGSIQGMLVILWG